ncbi:MAG: hypothetical protein ABF308_18220 [Phaeobacter gallaeciensis]|jgi:hypothetical protein
MSGPADVAPVTLDGVRYEAIHWGKQRGLGQNGGFVAAYDVASGDELWVQRIYEIVYGNKSPQKYDIFIRDMIPIDGGAALRIIDGTGRVFRLMLNNRDVLLVAEPVTAPTKPSPLKPPPATD